MGQVRTVYKKYALLSQLKEEFKMAGQKEQEEKKEPKKPYWQQVREGKKGKDPGPTVEELAFSGWKALSDLGAWIWGQKPKKTSTTTVRGAIRRKHTY